MERVHRLGAIQTRVSAMEWSEGGGGGRGEKKKEGRQVPQKSGSGCSTLAAHYGSSQVNVKTRESFAEYQFNAAAWAGEHACSRLHALYFPPIQNLEFLHLHTPERQREDALLCVVTLCEVQLCRESIWKWRTKYNTITKRQISCYFNSINLKENII